MDLTLEEHRRSRTATWAAVHPELYRHGFAVAMASRRMDPAAVPAAWRTVHLPGLVLHYDPGTTLLQSRSRIRTILAVGFLYAVDGSSAARIIDELATVPAGEFHDQLDRLSGRFLLVRWDAGGSPALYHDAVGSRSIFYSSEVPGVAASHSHLLAAIVQAPRDPAVSTFMSRPEYQARTVKYLPGDLTPWTGIRALVPNNCLDLARSATRRYWPRTLQCPTDFDRFAAAFDEHVGALGKAMAAEGTTPVFGMTAGVDCRSLFSAFKHKGVGFEGVTWRGSYLKDVEIPVVDEIVRHLGAPHAYVDPRQEADAVARRAGINSGCFRGGSRLTAGMHARYAHRRDTMFVRGYAGEVIRGFYSLHRNPMGDLSVDEMVRAYGSSIRGCDPSAAYREACGTWFRDYAQRANLGRIPPGFDAVADLFYWEHRMGMWASAMLNEMDSAIRSVIAINGRRLFALGWGLPRKERLAKSLLLRVTARYDEALARLPCH